MWCANCNADVAAEVSPGTGRVQCAVCQSELARADGIRESTKDAREILERWQNSDLMDSVVLPGNKEHEPIESADLTQPTADAVHASLPQMDSDSGANLADDHLGSSAIASDQPTDSRADTTNAVQTNDIRHEAAAGLEDAQSKIHEASRQALLESQEVRESVAKRSTRQVLESTKTRAASASSTAAAALAVADAASSRRKSKPKLRFDSPAAQPGAAAATARVRTRRPSKELRLDSAHPRVPEPHFEYTLRDPEPRPTNWSVLAGQWLAYGGVLALTVGTAIVVYGHFGGYSNYTPTGWLITTVGQMLLFLGVINLVSGGMEQSNDEVNQRIEILGEHILRIEQATDATLKGPKIAAAVYDGADPGAQKTASRIRVDSAEN